MSGFALLTREIGLPSTLGIEGCGRTVTLSSLLKKDELQLLVVMPGLRLFLP